MKIILLLIFCNYYLCIAAENSPITNDKLNEEDRADTGNADINGFIEEMIQAVKEFGCKYIGQLGEFCVQEIVLKKFTH